MRVLLTGASGFVGSALAPQLLRAGHEVRAFSRDATRVTGCNEVVEGDLDNGHGLDLACADVDVAYYLVHSMESNREAGSFADRELQQAERFAQVAVDSGIRRIVYLGVMMSSTGPSSEHLRSRERVEAALSTATPESVMLRSSIAIGARSRSFRLLVRLVERMPVLALPPWRRHLTQPVDERDLVAALAVSATTDQARGKSLSLDVAGPEVLSYQEMLERIRDLMMLRRPMTGFPFKFTTLVANTASVIAEEDPGLVLPLMRGLSGDILPRPGHSAECLGVRMHSYDSAVERALRIWEETEQLRAR